MAEQLDDGEAGRAERTSKVEECSQRFAEACSVKLVGAETPRQMQTSWGRRADPDNEGEEDEVVGVLAEMPTAPHLSL